MRQIGTLPDEKQARRFGDALLAHGIPNDVDPAGAEWAIWVHDDRHLEAAEEHLRRFLENPEPYAQAAREAGRVRAAQEADNRRAREQFIDLRTERQRRAFAPRPATTILIIMAVAAGIFTRLGAANNELKYWLFMPGYPAEGMAHGFERVLSGQVWRLFTPMLLHLGFLHLLFNLYWLYFLGGQIESVKRTGFFVFLVLFSEGLTNVVAGLLGEFGVGLSGVNYVLFGYIWMKQKYQPGEGLWLPPGTAIFMIGWMLLCLTGAVGPVGNIAHVSGLVIGVAFGIGPHLLKRARN